MNNLFIVTEFWVGFIVGMSVMVAFIYFKEWQSAKDTHKTEEVKNE